MAELQTAAALVAVLAACVAVAAAFFATRMARIAQALYEASQPPSAFQREYRNEFIAGFEKSLETMKNGAAEQCSATLAEWRGLVPQEAKNG